MLNGRIKIALTIIIFLGIFLIHTQYTDADIFAERNVQGNSFRATTLNFTVRNTINNAIIPALFNTTQIQPEGFDLGALKIKNESEKNIKYRLKVKKINGDEEFCNTLNIQVMTKSWTQKFNGKLMNLVVDSTMNSEALDNFIFFVSLDSNNSGLKNKICQFELDFRTYRNNPEGEAGIYAQRLINNLVTSGYW